MQEVVITELKPEHLAQVDHWTTRNSADKTLLKQPGVQPEPTSAYHGWAALDDEGVVAIVTVKLNKEHVGYINCIVKPMAKRQGIGMQIMEYALKQPFVANLVHLHAVIDPANTAGLKILNSLGFSRSGYDSNGYIELARHKY